VKKTMVSLLGIMLMATTAPALAKAAENWQFAVTPYLWAAGLDGTVSAKGHEADISKSFGDIVNDLDFTAMVNLQVRKGRFGAYTDVLFLGTSAEGHAGPKMWDVSASIDQWTVDFGASWAVAEWGAGGKGTKGAVDLLLGGRYWNFATKLTAENEFFDGGREVKEVTDWVDPVVGVRFAIDLMPKLQVVGRGDVGGFGLGDSTSELTWSTSAYLGWHFTPLVSAYAGWKYLSVERESDRGAEVDFALSGPVLGVAFTF